MNQKSAGTLEFPKILEQLAQQTSFSASRELALELQPTADIDAARQLQEETTEARNLLKSKTNIHFGGIFDVRAEALSCLRGFVLDPDVLLNVLSTLRRATTLRRIMTRLGAEYPMLSEIADQLEECPALQENIENTFNDTGEVKDSASVRLAVIRRDMKVAFDRLQSKINNIATSQNNAKYMQEPIVTQRNGRYVIPLKAEFKGRIKGVVHDQSSSGATLFIEPLTTVELNNRYRELQLEEANEIRRILAALSELVGDESESIVITVEILAYLDFVFARGKYGDMLDAEPVEMLPIEPDEDNDHPGSVIKLYQARHPLLDPKHIMPIDAVLDEETFILVITGPNTGGKTVALKTIGLLTLMSQCGLHLPVDPGSSISLFEDVYADIGDEQSIEQSLSTFSSHMTNIINTLELANSRSLIILDELGAGTDPVEGSALARAILTELHERSITTLITTHHPELKVFSFERSGVRNASVEFDLETLAPTYRLVVGLPGRSNALAIATRLGLPDSIVTRARSMVTTGELEVDDLLEEIRKTREDSRLSYERMKENEHESNELRRELADKMDALEDERYHLLQETRLQAEAEIEDLHTAIRDLKRRLQSAGQPLEAINQIGGYAERLTANIAQPPEKLERYEENGKDRSPRLGDKVWVTTLRTQGEVTEVGERDVEVMVGNLRIRAKLDEVEFRNRSDRRQESAKQRNQSERLISTPKGTSPGLELDLRGSRIDEALPKVESYLDAAYLSALPYVRIIHGKGTGALRNAIRDELRHHPLVSKYQAGTEKEGGDGVTVVNLVSPS